MSVNGLRPPRVSGFRDDDTEVIAAVGIGASKVYSHHFQVNAAPWAIQLGVMGGHGWNCCVMLDT
jgi:hypothetical protein